MGLTSAWLASALCLLSAGQPQASHPKDFWKGIVEAKFELPSGASAAELADELVANLGSPDPELRDDLSFSILTAWIYQKKLLGPADLRRISLVLQDNLRRGIGDRDGDSVVLRSFSALTLSVIAARENETPFLAPAEYRQLLNAALGYFRDERDLRGFDSRRGWLHSAAHTADLLKFLARNPQLERSEQSRLLSALLAKNTEAPAAFAQGEDERMARVVIAIARRADFDREAFRSWLSTAAAAATFPQPVTVEALRAQQNVRHLLGALWIELSTDDRPSEGADFARPALRAALKAIGF